MLLVSGREPGSVALRLRGGRVVERRDWLEPVEGERVLDLGGRFVRHGLRDAHVHVADWARSRSELDLSDARSAAQAVDSVATAASRLPPGARLSGGGFPLAEWADRPAAAALERAAPGRVVVLRSRDLHSAWLSPAALRLCGLTGHPSGLLREHEAWHALARLPVPPVAEQDAAVADALTAALARGVTALRDFDFDGAHPAWERRRAEAGGRLPVRVEAVVPWSALPAHADAGLRTGAGDEWLRVGPVKLFMDGSLGSRTARCLEPYAGTTDRGRQLLTPAALRQALAEITAAGFGVAVHAIGDEACRDALRALADVGCGGTLEHAQQLRAADLPLFAAADVTASIQPAHLLDDRDLVDTLWAGSASTAYAGASLLRAGAELAFGSDAPVAPLDPWLAVAAAVHRTDGSAPPWHPEEAIGLEEALVASGARPLRVGDRADVVVLDVPDLAELSAAELADVPIWATFVGGRCAHGGVEGG